MSETFRAIRVSRDEAKQQSVDIVDMSMDELMDGDVDVAVEATTVNYKDGLAITGRGPVVRRWPLIPGIDLAGTVLRSTHAHWKEGDKVVLNGWAVGETHHGAFAGRARLNGDWLVPLRQIDYRQQGGRIQVRVNGVGNFETLIEHVARFEPGFALAENIGNVGVSGSYQATLSSAEQARLRSVRIEPALEPGASGVSVGSGRGQVFRQVTRLRNRPDGFVNE